MSNKKYDNKEKQLRQTNFNNITSAVNKIQSSTSYLDTINNISINKSIFDNNTKAISDILSKFDTSKITSNYLDIFSDIDFNSFSLFPEANSKVQQLEKEINEKEEHIKTLFNQIKSNQYKNDEQKNKVEELIKSKDELEKKHELAFLTCRIHPNSIQNLLTEDSILLNNFTDGESKQMVVMTIDIRRSTELMLKAKNHTTYAEFITGLSDKLRNAVIGNYGIFDKFTGDGILSYFPEFYCGEKAIINCLNAATQCQIIFNEYYKENRNKFSVIINTGLGIGIDYGYAKIVKINAEQTIVGSPVVYACRLSGAPANTILINQSAIEKLEVSNELFKVEEFQFDLKNEGIAFVYKLIEYKYIELEEPKWI